MLRVKGVGRSRLLAFGFFVWGLGFRIDFVGLLQHLEFEVQASPDV